jgi:hypothetical protein
MGNHKDDVISLMMEETFKSNSATCASVESVAKFGVTKDRQFLFFNKNTANIMIPANWSVFKELVSHSAEKSFFYIFISEHNDVNKLREIFLNDQSVNLLFYTFNGEIYYEEIVGANIFPKINKILKQAA